MMNDKTVSFEKALHRTQALCAKQERCTNDLRIKMKQWHVSTEDIEKVINKLISDGFVNDERFAHMFARDKSKFNKWGPIKIAYSLKSKHIPDDLIKIILLEIEPEQNDKSVYEMLSKKAKSIKAKSTQDLKVKLIRFGISRGYDYGLISSIASSIIKEE
jgi:regulatory protein